MSEVYIKRGNEKKLTDYIKYIINTKYMNLLLMYKDENDKKQFIDTFDMSGMSSFKNVLYSEQTSSGVEILKYDYKIKYKTYDIAFYLYTKPIYEVPTDKEVYVKEYRMFDKWIRVV